MIINLFDIPQNDEKVGGGWSFLRNFKKGLEEAGHKISSENYDLSMVCGATMVTRQQWEEAKNKPRVLRADGIPEDFRNRGTGWSRIRDYANEANLVIYQSEFSKNTTGRLLKKDGSIIMNGVDTSVFKPDGPTDSKFGSPSIIYNHFRNDPNKRFQEVIERFRQYKIDNPKSAITFIGDYPKDQVRWTEKWDFGMLDYKQDADWRYLGIIKDRKELAKKLRSAEFFAWPSFADPCPNTLIEALSCGLQPIWTNLYGSTDEIHNKFKDKYDFSLSNMIRQYIKEFEKLL